MVPKKLILLMAAPLALLANAPAREASIPFVDMGSIRDWRADGSNALYVQDLRGNWYHADLMGNCSELPFADTIGFETQGNNSLDKFGAVVVRGQRCVFQNFVTSDGPPKKVKASKKTVPVE